MCIFVHPTTPLEPLTNVEKRVEMKIYERNSFIISGYSFKEKITYFKDENRNSKKNNVINKIEIL